MRCTFSMFVCVRPAGDDAAITTVSPAAARPASRSPSSMSAIIASVSAGTPAGSDVTPHSSAFAAAHRRVGDERDDRHARPLDREQPRGPARLRVAGDRGEVGRRPWRSRPRHARRRRPPRVCARPAARPGTRRPRDSAALAILVAAEAASNGYSPIAVSPDSMMASAPSSTAFATSLASARVGLGARIIDSSICVATTTGRPAARAGAHQVLLQQRDLLHRQLDPEVAPRHHQRVGRPRGSVDPLDRRLRLDLRDDRHGALPHQRPQLRDVLGPAHERLRHEIHLEGQHPPERLAIAVGDGRQAEPLGRHVHALAGADRAAADALRHDDVALDRARPKLHRAVGEQHAVAARAGPPPGPDSVVPAPAASPGPPGRSRNDWPGRSGSGSGTTSPRRTFGPGRSASTASTGRCRARPRARCRPRARARRACRARQFTRNTVAPASTRPRTIFGVALAGPSVQTSSSCAPSSRRGLAQRRRDGSPASAEGALDPRGGQLVGDASPAISAK